MNISDFIKSLLAAKGKKQQDIMELVGVSSKQALSVKFSRGSWSVEDLAKICSFCGVDLCVLDGNNKSVLNSFRG